jgi:hypothetical protein
MLYRCWAENIQGTSKLVQANKPHSAALIFAGELWHSEEWEGEDTLRVVVQNDAGSVVMYPITAGIRLHLSVGTADVRANPSSLTAGVR